MKKPHNAQDVQAPVLYRDEGYISCYIPPILDHTVNHAIKKSLRISTSVMGIVISSLNLRVKRLDLSIQIRMSFRPQYRLFFHCHKAQAYKQPFLLMYDIS